MRRARCPRAPMPRIAAPMSSTDRTRPRTDPRDDRHDQREHRPGRRPVARDSVRSRRSRSDRRGPGDNRSPDPTSSRPPPMSRPSQKATVTATRDDITRMKISAASRPTGTCTTNATLPIDRSVPSWCAASTFQSLELPQGLRRPTSTTRTTGGDLATWSRRSVRVRRPGVPRPPRRGCGCGPAERRRRIRAATHP